MQQYSPCKLGSQWSRANKTRGERLSALGLLAPAEQAVIDAARASGSSVKLIEWYMKHDFVRGEI